MTSESELSPIILSARVRSLAENIYNLLVIIRERERIPVSAKHSLRLALGDLKKSIEIIEEVLE